MNTEENVSNVTKDLTSFICERIKENEEFLNKNAKDVYEEVIELVNDSIDLEILLAKKFKAEEAVTHPIIFFAMHVFMPLSYGIYANLLLGNLPACFMELRLILESLVECYYAEKIPGQMDFATKLEALERALNKNNISTSKVMKELGSDFIRLWGKLSGEWVHSKGIRNHIIRNVVEKGIPPSWGIGPVGYTEEDLEDIKELGKRVAKFRKLLKNVISELYSS